MLNDRARTVKKIRFEYGCKSKPIEVLRSNLPFIELRQTDQTIKSRMASLTDFSGWAFGIK